MINTSEQSTLKAIAAMISAHGDDVDPRLTGVQTKAQELIDGADAEQAADRLEKAQGPSERSAALSYLRQHSPSAAAAWEAGHAA